MTIAASVFLSCNVFFSTRQLNPFCDSALNASDFLSDNCEPCPNNGQCYRGKLECVRGYRKYRNSCVEDGDINQTAKKLVGLKNLVHSGMQLQLAQQSLCESYAQYLCGGTGTIWVQEDDIWSVLDGEKLTEHVGSDNAINNYTKHKAMETICKVLETRTNSQGVSKLKRPDVLAESYKPFSCRMHHWISNNLLVILPVCVLIVGLILLIRKVHKRLYLSKRVDELYEQVCEILEENALTSKGRHGDLESWLLSLGCGIIFFRQKGGRNLHYGKSDESNILVALKLLCQMNKVDVQMYVFQNAHVEELTYLEFTVEDLIKEDSRVERYPNLVKGESKVVWEWQVEGSLSSTRMRQKGESSKRKSPASMALNSDQHLARLKTETKGLLF